MKNRYVPSFFSLRKGLIATIVCAIILLIVLIIVLIIRDEILSIVLPIPFAGLLYFFSCLFLHDLVKTSKKYLIREKDIICIDPFKKKSIIDLDKIKAIYIVVYTYADTLGTGRYMVIRDTTDKHKKIYDVILLREGYLSSRIISDDSCFTIEQCKRYVLYDFCYDSDSILQLLEKTKANVYTNKEMYDVITKTPAFTEYRDRIIKTNLNKGLMDRRD